MGCGTSIATETGDTELKKDMDDLMGKKIPKVCTTCICSSS